MPLFNNKNPEEKTTGLEKQLQTQTIENQKLIAENRLLNERIKKAEKEHTDILKKERVNSNIRFNKEIDLYIARQIEMEGIISGLEEQVKNRNPYNVGRKSKSTPETVSEILRLRREGVSFGEIAKALQTQTGSYICKTTVKKIYDSHRMDINQL